MHILNIAPDNAYCQIFEFIRGGGESERVTFDDLKFMWILANRHMNFCESSNKYFFDDFGLCCHRGCAATDIPVRDQAEH